MFKPLVLAVFLLAVPFSVSLNPHLKTPELQRMSRKFVVQPSSPTGRSLAFWRLGDGLRAWSSWFRGDSSGSGGDNNSGDWSSGSDSSNGDNGSSSPSGDNGSYSPSGDNGSDNYNSNNGDGSQSSWSSPPPPSPSPTYDQQPSPSPSPAPSQPTENMDNNQNSQQQSYDQGVNSGILNECSQTDRGADAVFRCTNYVRKHPEAFASHYPCGYDSFKREVEGTNRWTLAYDYPLSQAANSHASAMAERQQLQHEGPKDGSDVYKRARDAGFNTSPVAQNIANGDKGAFGLVMDWMCDYEKRKNIISCDFDRLGMGLSWGGDGKPYYVQMFGCSTDNQCKCS